MPAIKPEIFDNKDLNFQVRLETCVGNNFIDFTGKQSFRFELFRENIGFGITDISVEVNPSLQPLVEITFKDMYGNTIFDQEREGTDLDYRVLFNWPPPKFMFTFKGYLGQPVTWILNLKKYNVNYDPSDNSYEIKASFVPNQWGFFADLPVLYLLAVKRLKKNAGLLDDGSQYTNRFSDDAVKAATKAQTLFDLVKIGKQADIKAKQVTKEFDQLQSILGGLKTNALGAIVISKLVNFGDIIDGKVGNRFVTAGILEGDNSATRFVKIQIPETGNNSDALGLSEKELKNFASRSQDIGLLNKFIILKSKFAGESSSVLSKNSVSTFGEFKRLMGVKEPPRRSRGDISSIADAAAEAAGPASNRDDSRYANPGNVDDVDKAYRQRLDVINDNLALVEQAIQQSVFEANESKLEQLTIGEVFSRLAGDSAYILGRILEEGIKGYAANSSEEGSTGEIGGSGGSTNPSNVAVQGRDGNERLIGLHYPMELDPNDSGKEIPARDVGIEDFELKFVNEFIEAVAEGIAENQALLAQSTQQDPSELKKRINNLEILQQNPYKPYYESVATNILERSGIAAFITRSSDPNLPGDFNNGTFGFDRDGIDDISKLANADFENIPDSIILEMPPEDRERLKDFCSFWDRALANGGEGLRNQDPTQESEQPLGVDGNGNPIKMHYRPGSKLNDDILNFEVNLELDEDNNPVPGRTFTIKQFMDDVCTPLLRINNGDLLEQAGWVDSAYTLYRMRNNGIPYFSNTEPNTYFIVVFEGPDAVNAQGKRTAPTDIEFANNDLDERGTFDVGQVETIYGVVPIEQYLNEDNEEAGRITTFNEYVDANRAISYSRLIDGIEDFGLTFREKSVEDQASVPYFVADGITPVTFGNKVVSTRALTQQELENIGGGVNGYILVKDLSFTQRTTINSDSGINYRILPGGRIESRDGFVFNNPSSFVLSESNFRWNQRVVAQPTSSLETSAEGLAYAIYQHSNDLNSFGALQLVFCPFMRDNISESGAENSAFSDDVNSGRNQRVFLKVMCRNVLQKIRRIEEEQNQIIGNILGKAEEQKDVIYKQFHLLFNQWNALAFEDIEQLSGEESEIGKLCVPLRDSKDIARNLERRYGAKQDLFSPRDLLSSDPSEEELEDVFGEDDDGINITGGVGSKAPESGTFRYDFPMNSLNNAQIKVSESIISIEPLYKVKANTSVLNVIQQICTKNNFIFIPIAGNANYRSIKEIYKPFPNQVTTIIRNYFHVLFAPTPERRVYTNGKNALLNSIPNPENFAVDALLVEFGSPDNQIVKSLNVGTDENKTTAESIVNLQRLVDNENQNKTVTTNCSMLSVLEGRSYKAKIETLGNAQIYPMQYFYINRTPLFGGLYQIMKVRHTIKANDFDTQYEGIKIVQTSDNYGGVQPITLDSLRKIDVFSQPQVGVSPEEESALIEAFSSLAEDAAEQVQSLQNNSPSEVSRTINSGRNGRIPAEELTRSEALARNLSGDKPFLIEAAAKSFDKMIAAFDKASFPGKQAITFTDGYRSIERQRALKKKYGKFAASPGTSVHGLGMAVDMWWGVMTKTGKSYSTRPVGYRHPNYQWFHKNAHKWGWYNPAKLRDDAGSIDEFWHWEYHGSKGPAPALTGRYATPWKKERDVPVIKKDGGIYR